MKDRLHDEVMAEIFSADPFYAASLLLEVQKDGCAAELETLLHQLSRAFGWEVASTIK